jgi:hypothetical protein
MKMILCFFLCTMFIFTASVFSADDYSLDYSTISMGGSRGTSANYEMNDSLLLYGIGGESQSSTDYSVTTTAGLEDDNNAGIDIWMLY